MTTAQPSTQLCPLNWFPVQFHLQLSTGLLDQEAEDSEDWQQQQKNHPHWLWAWQLHRGAVLAFCYSLLTNNCVANQSSRSQIIKLTDEKRTTTFVLSEETERLWNEHHHSGPFLLFMIESACLHVFSNVNLWILKGKTCLKAGKMGVLPCAPVCVCV